MAEQYHVKITGPGINVERDIPEPLAQKLLVAALTGEAKDLGQPAAGHRGIPGAGHGRPSGASEEEHADSVANYLAAAQAASIPQKITAIGNYLKKYRNKATFTQDDLEQGFEDAADSVPKNLSRDLKDTVRSGWIAAKQGEKGAYYVTGSGTKAVGAKFEGHGKGRKRGTRRASRATKKAAKSSE
jgi:hypothetical protein